MKLVRFGRAGAERPGVIDADGKLRDLSRIINGRDAGRARAGGLARLRVRQGPPLPLVRGRPRLAARWAPSARWCASGSTTPTTRRGRHAAPQGAHTCSFFACCRLAPLAVLTVVHKRQPLGSPDLVGRDSPSGPWDRTCRALAFVVVPRAPSGTRARKTSFHEAVAGEYPKRVDLLDVARRRGPSRRRALTS